MFTGFWETSSPHTPLGTTAGPVSVDELLERLRGKLTEVKPGARVRIDLIAWEDEE